MQQELPRILLATATLVPCAEDGSIVMDSGKRQALFEDGLAIVRSVKGITIINEARTLGTVGISGLATDVEALRSVLNESRRSVISGTVVGATED